MNPLISVIATTYNWPEALDRVLASLALQSDQNFEVIVADDGSGPETRNLVERFAADAPFPVRHFWQEDEGFRVARCRNGAVSLSRGDYIVFIDGDCCLLPDFITSHRKLMEAGAFVTGKRTFIKQRFTKFILSKKLDCFRWPRGLWFFLALFGQSNRPFQFIKLPQTEQRMWKAADQWEKAQTCNLGVWRSDLMTVAGFDESYQGHGLEDSDFVIRLLRSGLRRKTAEYISPVLHLFHGRPTYGAEQVSNGKRFEKLRAEPERFLAVKSMLATTAPSS